MTTSHIASLIVRTRPDLMREVAARIDREPHIEVHAAEAGKIIVVVESTSERALADCMDALRAEPEVLMVSLVYHAVDDAPDDLPPADTPAISAEKELT